MTAERLVEEPKVIELTCVESQDPVVMHIGDTFSLFGTPGFVLEADTGERLKSSDTRQTPVLLISHSGAALADFYLPTVKVGKRVFYRILGDSVAASVIEQRKQSQK